MDYLNLIKEGLQEYVSDTEITPDTNIKSLGIDSIDFVDLVFNLEEELDITFEDEELLEIKTIQDLLNKIEEKK